MGGGIEFAEAGLETSRRRKGAQAMLRNALHPSRHLFLIAATVSLLVGGLGGTAAAKDCTSDLDCDTGYQCVLAQTGAGTTGGGVSSSRDRRKPQPGAPAQQELTTAGRLRLLRPSCLRWMQALRRFSPCQTPGRCLPGPCPRRPSPGFASPNPSSVPPWPTVPARISLAKRLHHGSCFPMSVRTRSATNHRRR